MTALEDELRRALRTQAQALRVPEPPALDRCLVEPPRHLRRRWLAVAACVARHRGRRRRPRPVAGRQS